MNNAQLLALSLLVAGCLLVLILAIVIKLRGPTRWSLGIGLGVIAGAILFLGWILVSDRENLNWRLVSFLAAMLGAFSAGLRQFARLAPPSGTSPDQAPHDDTM